MFHHGCEPPRVRLERSTGTSITMGKDPVTTSRTPVTTWPVEDQYNHGHHGQDLGHYGLHVRHADHARLVCDFTYIS